MASATGYSIEIKPTVGSDYNLQDLRFVTLKVGSTEYIARPDSKDAPTKFLFNLPKILDGEVVSLKTPQFFSGSISVDVKALSQGEGGDVAMSQNPVTMTVNIAAEADGVSITTLDGGMGVEDSQTGVKLPARVARKDASESISEITIEGNGQIDKVVYLTRFEMLKTNPSINSELSGITGVFDIADYEVKGDGSYVITSGASTFDASSLQRSAGLKIVIAGDIGKTIPNISALRSVDAIDSALTGAGFVEGNDYIYVLEGTSGGRSITSAVDWDGSSLSAYTDTQVNRDLAAKFMKEKTLSHDLDAYVTKTGDTFAINVESWMAANGTTNVKAADWLANHVGIETAPNVSGTVNVNVSYTTKTSDGSDTKTSTEALSLKIMDRADPIPFTNPDTADDVASGGESAASVAGITLLTRTGDSLGAFDVGDGLEGSLGASDVSGYMVQVSLTSGASLSGMQKGLALKIGDTEYIGRPDSKDAPTKFAFSLPKLGEGESISLKTPEFFNTGTVGSVKVEFSTLSQGSAGDVAMSDPVTMTVNIAAEADGVSITTLDGGMGVEDSQTGVKLPARVARKDASESISEITIEGNGQIDKVVYLTRFEMLKTNPSINSELSGITGVFDIADYEVKGDGSYVITSGASTFDASSLGVSKLV